MTPHLINGLTTAAAYRNAGGGNTAEQNVVCALNEDLGALQGVTTERFIPVSALSDGVKVKNAYLPSLEMPEPKLEELASFLLDSGARIMVRCASTLEEVGLMDTRFGLSPVMLLHRLGLLGGALIAGGVWLDKDDIALMRQEGAGLVLLPSCDLGRGFGIPPLAACLGGGVEVRLGTGDGKYNPAADLYREAWLLKLAVNAHMNRENAVTDAQLCRILTGSDGAADEIARKLYG